MSEAVNNANTVENYDAQQTVEEIQEGDRKAPTANVEADYEASKQFSTSPIDQTQEGTDAANAATASQFELPEPDESLSNSQLDATGNPDDYQQMAREIDSIPDGAKSASVGSLYEKAMEKGKAGA